MDASTETINPTEKVLNSIFANTRFESAAAAAVATEDEDGTELSLRQLRSALKENLRSSDTLNAVKAHIRKDLIHGLLKSGGKSRTSNLSVKARMILSAMHHFMKASSMHGTLSVFMAESGLENNRNVLNEVDIARLFKLHQLRTTYLQAATKPVLDHPTHQGQADGSALPPSPASLLEVMFDFCLMAQQECFRDESCQTDVHGPSARELLDLDLQGIRRTLSMRQQQEVASPLRTIEERMLAYQRECDERSRKEVALQVQLFKEQELAKLRSEEKQRYQKEMLSYRAAVDTDYQQRLVLHLEREHQASKRLQELERSHQAQLHEQRQQLLHQLEVARQNEEALQRKTQLELEGLKSLEFRLKEASLALQAREQQVLRAEQAILVQQSECLEIAKKAARKELEEERQEYLESKKKLLMERAIVDQEKQSILSVRIHLDQLQQQVKSQQDELAKKEVEISALKKAEEFRLAQQLAEEQHIAKLLEAVDPSLSRLSRTQQMLTLLKHSSELQQQLDLLHDGQALLQALEEKDEEVARIRATMRESLERWERERQQLRRESDEAREKQGKQQRDVQVLVEQVEKMKSLVVEKNQLIDTLSRRPSPASTLSPFSLTHGLEGEKLALPAASSARLSSSAHAYTIFAAPSWQRPTQISPGHASGPGATALGSTASSSIASLAAGGQRRPFSSSPLPEDVAEEEASWMEKFPPRPAYLQSYERSIDSLSRKSRQLPEEWEGRGEEEEYREVDTQLKERELRLQQRRQSIQVREAQLQELKAQSAAKREAALEFQRQVEQKLDREEALQREAEHEQWLLQQEQRELQLRMEREQSQRQRQIEEQKRRLQALRVGQEEPEGRGVVAEPRIESRLVGDEAASGRQERLDKPVESVAVETTSRGRDVEDREARETARLASEEKDLERERELEFERARELEKAREREREKERAREREKEREREREKERERERERERQRLEAEAEAEERRQKEKLRQAQQALEEERERSRIEQEKERERLLTQQREQEEREQAERARQRAEHDEALRTERELKQREAEDAKELADARAKVLARRKKSAVGSSVESLDSARVSMDSLAGSVTAEDPSANRVGMTMSQAGASSEGVGHVKIPSFAAPRPQSSTALIFGSDESHENIEVLDDESDEGNRFL